MKWIKRHKIAVAIISFFLILILLMFAYVWNKLGLIQYDNDKNSVGKTNDPISTDEQINSDDENIIAEEDISNLPQIETEPTIPESPVWNNSDVLNILLIGTDERSDEFSDNARSDSMILISLNKSTKEIKLVSLERGIGVPVLKGQYEGQYDWLTHIFRYGGADLLLETIQTCFSVDIDYYVRMNFHTVTTAIDAIGGVDIELTREEAEFLNDPDALYMWLGKESRPVTVGMNHMDGVTALTYSRIRKIDSDWKRVERQRKVIVAVTEKLKASGFIGLDELTNQVFPLIQTNFTKLEILELIFLVPNFLNAEIEQTTVPLENTHGIMKGMDGRTLYAVDFETNAAFLHEYLYGNVSMDE